MDQTSLKKVLKTLVNGIVVAQKRGAYTLEESSILYYQIKSLSSLSKINKKIEEELES
tara:strand:- start:355 stop:528 length:174 start_codon:yes stop_codon:yes gene_type:complete